MGLFQKSSIARVILLFSDHAMLYLIDLLSSLLRKRLFLYYTAFVRAKYLSKFWAQLYDAKSKEGFITELELLNLRE